MSFLTRILPSFLVSWLLTFTLASLFHSQYVVNELVNVGVVVGFSDRASLTLDDWLGLSTYLRGYYCCGTCHRFFCYNKA